ncbi:MAG TPA: hypothetical protein VMG98_03730 [Verrucomicrobiae bacterium]|nr:hypothetical protein [Verrucomicrobiae bacterium]
MLIAHMLAAALWTCSVALLPDYKPKTTAADVGEGVTYLYVGDRHLRDDYGADAVFTTPPDGRRGWYDSAIHFGPFDNEDVSAQIEISRWERFDYRPHIAIAWALPRSKTVEYKDTSLFVEDDRPHRLGIYVRAGSLRLVVDDRTICSAPASLFVRPSERKYFQIRTETSVLGRNSGAMVMQLRLKRDADRTPIAFYSHCIMHRNGIFWQERSPGIFAARGAFYPNESTFFTGLTADSRCKA